MSDVTCVGLHCADVILYTVPHLPTGQDQILLDDVLWTVGGTAAATAVDLARLGVSVSTVGAVGQDPFGDFFVREMSREGVDTAHLAQLPGQTTSTSVLPISPRGDRPALYLVGALGELSLDMMPWEVIESSKVLHLGGTLLLPKLDGQPSAEILARAQASGVITTLDFIPDFEPHMLDRLRPALPHVDYLLPNMEEGMAVAGASSRQEAIEFYLAEGVKCVVMTLGEDGVSITTQRDDEILIPAYDVDVVDTIGSGDAFSAGFIAALVEGKSPLEAIELGVACGSLAATGRGSLEALVDRQTVEEFAATASRGRVIST